MVSILGSVGLAPAVGVVLVLAAVGCGSKVATLAQAESPTPSISPVSELAAVPWADRPGRFFEPSPLPAHLLRHRPWWRRMQPPGLQMLRTTQC